MKNRGEIVRQEIAKSGLTMRSIADKIGVSRKTLYNWIEEINMPWERIFAIGKAIRHDFSTNFPELKKPDVLQEPLPYYEVKSLEECLRELDYYKTKVIDLLEERDRLRHDIEKLNTRRARDKINTQ